MSRSQILLFCLFLCWGLNVFAQKGELSVTNKKALKYYEKALTLYRQHHEKEALGFLDQALEKEPDFVEAWLLKGDLLMSSGNKVQAVRALEKAVAVDSTYFPAVWVMLGSLYYDLGDYQKSVNAYQSFLSGGKLSEKRRKEIVKLLRLAKSAEELTRMNVDWPVERLSGSVNTSADEYINYANVFNDSIIFTRKISIQKNRAVELFYESHWFNGDTVVKRLKLKWLENKNAGSLSFSYQGDKMFFAGCGWEEGFGSCDLYVSEKKEGSWREPVNLGKEVNTAGWESQPFVSEDGQFLFFSSRRKGGRGGSDIWFSKKMRDGRWSPPVNMGDSINTPGNEMAPFLYADGKTLVFSSDGRGGLGGKDLFISRKNRAGIWSKAQNMGLPVNSSYHDINLIYSLDGKTVWVSSDRNGKGYDIYKIPVYRRIKPFPVLFVNGRVMDSITGKSLNALVLVNDVISLKTIDSIKTDRKGSFLLVLDHAGKYIFDIAAPGYLPFSQTIVFKDTGVVASELHKEFRLKPLKKGETFVLRNVYFDLDRYSLTPASSVELNRLVAWLNENPNVHLFITGHTDNLGSKEHNKKLSEKRAYAVYHYLTNHGVDKKRLEYKGCGDENPLAPNDTEKNRRLNRRVEFKVQ